MPYFFRDNIDNIDNIDKEDLQQLYKSHGNKRVITAEVRTIIFDLYSNADDLVLDHCEDYPDVPRCIRVTEYGVFRKPKKNRVYNRVEK